MLRSRPPVFAALAAMLAAFVVHQARYAVVPDHHSDSHHGYLAHAPELLGLGLAAALAVALARLIAGVELSAARRTPLGVRWLGATVLLVCVHSAQELAEGHLIELAGRGAWVVLPLSAVAGLGLAVLLEGAHSLLHAGARALRPLSPLGRPQVAVTPASGPGAAPMLRRLSALAAAGAGRGPPPVG